MKWCCIFFLCVLLLGTLPLGVFGSGGCENRPDEIVCRSGPSDDEIELNRLRSLTKEERAWEMLQSMDLKIRLGASKKPLNDLPKK